MKEEKPPFGKSWKNLYLLLVILLAGCIITFYLISRHFS
jgi:hypothetical protein